MVGSRYAVSTSPPRIFDRISVLSDPIRCRILLLLENRELTVSELCTVLQLPQSTVSRHLKTLADDDWVEARRDGTSRRYSARQEAIDPTGRRLWQLLRQEVAAGPSGAQDRYRLEAVLARRRSKSQEFFSSTAGQWSELRRDLFGARFDLLGMLALVEEQWVVGDLGCGTGETAISVAPFVRQVIAIDESEAMLAAASQNLAGMENVELRQGRLESLPVAADSLDAVMMILVLHHLSDPPRVLSEAARALRSGGKLVVVDMMPHERHEYRHQMGHIWLGFHHRQLTEWLGGEGFQSIRIRPLQAEPEAKGPTLFAATARRASAAPKTTTRS